MKREIRKIRKRMRGKERNVSKEKRRRAVRKGREKKEIVAMVRVKMRMRVSYHARRGAGQGRTEVSRV